MKTKIVIISTLILLMFHQLDLQAVPNDSLSKKEHDSIDMIDALAITGVYYGASIYVLNQTWYKDRNSVPFHFYDDSKAYLQVDKFGHAFGSYFYSYVGFKGMQYLGFSEKESLIYGGSLGFVLQLPIEIMDGLHEGWGFSWSDIIANASGSMFVIGQQLLFKEQIAKFKFSYWESEYSKNANGYLGTNTFEKMLDDYNGHTYWLSLPINTLLQESIVPEWLCISLGYGANGMYGEYTNITEYEGVKIPATPRYRQFLFSLDIDWTKIQTKSEVLNIILKGLTFIKLPFPALEYNSLGKFDYHWVYY